MAGQSDFARSMTMTPDQAPTWFRYDDAFLSFLEYELPRIGPWRFLTAENQEGLWQYILSERNADCVPFVACLASDEMIGWHFIDGSLKLIVFTVHDPAEFQVERPLASIWEALHYMIEDIRFRTES